MKCDIGRLQAYLHDALSTDARAEVEAHLAGCDPCQARLETLHERERIVAGRLAILDPTPNEAPDAAQALAQFRAVVQPAPTSPWNTLKERIEIMRQTLLTGRWRPAAIGLVALAIVAALFSFAPVRQAAAEFLGMFRVRKFAVIPIDPAQLERLESLGDLADSGVFGEPTVLREPGEPQEVADAAEAGQVAGFTVRTPTALAENIHLKKITVESGPAMRYEVERGMMELALEAAGLTGVTLPAFDAIPLEADFPAVVQQHYLVDGRGVTLLQMPSPTLTVPPGIEPAFFGEILLRLLGLPDEEARRMAKSIDWTSTLVIPMPTDVGSFHEVEVDGVTGMMLEEQRQNRSYGRLHRMVLWQRDGIIYSVEGTADSTVLLMLANSLQ